MVYRKIGELETEAVKRVIGKKCLDLFNKSSSHRLASHYMHLHHVCYYSRWPWWLLRAGGLALG